MESAYGPNITGIHNKDLEENLFYIFHRHKQELKFYEKLTKLNSL